MEFEKLKVGEQFEGISTVFFRYQGENGSAPGRSRGGKKDDKSGIFESTAEVSEKTSAE